jgi:fibro-slime domain-containing protein
MCWWGQQLCNAAGTWDSCVGAVYPEPEICNAADDDCNGVEDELLPQACTTACGSGVETCVSGQWTGCTAPPVEPEVCDGVDNDCNGHTDDGLVQACTTACGSGVETCDNGSWVGCTAPPVEPEVCDGADNDCNGHTDDGLVQACATACGTGVETCHSGSWVGCTAPPVEPEVCDGVDNDCNGHTDEGLTQLCTTACGNGVETCDNGSWAGCTAPPVEPEVCDGVDNDCNGHVDDGLVQACATACGTGVETCHSGSWVGCTAPPVQVEVCDGNDNNCDGNVDEGLFQACGVCNGGTQQCSNGAWGTCQEPAPATSIPLTGTVRDFNDSHPDMEWNIAFDPGIVQVQLGNDGKPVYAHGTSATATVHNQTTFNQWYNNVSGVNLSAPLTITLNLIANSSPPTYTYSNSNFFPIDNQLLGNQGRSHNYHFTYEIHTQFRYKGGEQFTFRGDDDLWVFINGRRVIDLGGVHGVMEATVNLDAVAASIGISLCNVYRFDLFFAERHTTQSNFRIDTSIGLFES